MKTSVKVAISVPGRFHLFYLAQELLRRDYLSQLITSYPKFEVAKYGIPKEKVSSVVIKEIIERGWRRLPSFLRRIYNPQYRIHQLFDACAARALRRADLVTGSSSVFLATLRKAKSFGAVTVVDRGSSHIRAQYEILKEEYARWGMTPAPFQAPHPGVVERELREYEEAEYIAISSVFAKKTFIAHGVPNHKLIHIPYGVNLSSFRQIPKTDKLFRVIFVGGMTLRKGVQYLLQAFSELRLRNAELLLVGALTDEMKPFFKRYKGSYRWIDAAPQAELYKYYSESSVFVLNSVEDGFGMVIIQAMACGLPVIATDHTGALDIVRDGIDGFIIPIRDTWALKEKLLFLYEHKEQSATMGASAKARVSSGFRWEDYGSKMIRAYETIMA